MKQHGRSGNSAHFPFPRLRSASTGGAEAGAEAGVGVEATGGGSRGGASSEGPNFSPVCGERWGRSGHGSRGPGPAGHLEPPSVHCSRGPGRRGPRPPPFAAAPRCSAAFCRCGPGRCGPGCCGPGRHAGRGGRAGAPAATPTPAGRCGSASEDRPRPFSRAGRRPRTGLGGPFSRRSRGIGRAGRGEIHEPVLAGMPPARKRTGRHRGSNSFEESRSSFVNLGRAIERDTCFLSSLRSRPFRSLVSRLL